MEYTKTERKEIARLFKDAKAFLSHDNDGTYVSDVSYHICSSISLAANSSGRHRLHTVRRAKSIISERLDGYGTFVQWLMNQSPKIRREVKQDISINSGRKVQAHRHAWLDMLIEEFSE